MDKAMLLLVQMASRGAVDVSKVGPSKPGNFVSIKLLDDQGNKVTEDQGRVLSEAEAEPVNPRKRLHRRVDGEENVEGDAGGVEATTGMVNKTVTLVGNHILMTNTVDPRSRREAIRVEIQPTERWTGGATVPLRALKIFNLSQDAVAYEGRRRDELVDRCKGRARRFLADFMHIMEEFKGDSDGEVHAKLEAEITALKGEKKKIGASCSELEKRSGDLASANSALSKKIGEMEVAEQSLTNKVFELETRLWEVEKERDEEKTKCEGLDRQIDGMNGSYRLIVEENESLKLKVQKGVKDITEALGDGYDRCVRRMTEAGINVEGHTFEDYLRDLVASQDVDREGEECPVN
ncbi:uncharacterized protein LOC141723370 [Apium graveolens]|uniref:uncharacterized protein LOC141723370 n=1 Tax=Apium graveolens TaxID=4045 RepID=UPI003D794C88